MGSLDLLTTMTRDVMSQIASAKTATELWKAVHKVFSSRAWSVNTRIALATTKKGFLTAADYIAKMKAQADDMAVTGKPL